MRPKFLLVLEMAIDAGVARGYRRAHKHTDAPTDEAVISTIQECVLSSIYECFDFDND